MEIDRQKISQILNMSEKEFASLIYTVVFSATADNTKAQMAMGIAPMIREKLRTSNEYELKKLLDSLGEEKMRDILNSLES